jgi:hypothetical protein
LPATVGCIEVDEIWGFVQKKQRHVKKDEDPTNVGDIWTYIVLCRIATSRTKRTAS